jgi:hypothetical protein
MITSVSSDHELTTSIGAYKAVATPAAGYGTYKTYTPPKGGYGTYGTYQKE